MPISGFINAIRRVWAPSAGELRLVERRPGVYRMLGFTEKSHMTTPKHSPGTVRDAIVAYLDKTKEDAG